MGRFAVVFCWVIAALMSSPMSAVAAPVDWLYDVAVPVADQSADARGAAFKQALLVAVKRMSGLTDVPSNPTVASALESPQRFYVEYRYREADNPIAGATPPKVLMLSVRFAENAIQKLIADAGLPLWSSNRPTTLAWIAVIDGPARTVLGAGDRSALSAAMRARASERGLPLVLPAMDLDEQLQVSEAAVAAGMSAVIEQASDRYTPDQILVGRVTRGANNAWSVDCQVSEHGNLQSFKLESPAPEAAGAAIVDRLVEALVARYAVSSGTQERLQIQVDGVSGVGDYGALMKYLSGLEFIDSVRIEEVRPNTVLLSLATRTPWDRLRDLLALDGRLAAPEVSEVGAGRRVLIWRGDLHR
jgi:uncharacterized protein